MHEINSKPIVSQPLPESHKCPNCVREFTSEHALLKHLEDHQNDKFKSPAKKPATPIKNNRPPAKVFVYNAAVCLQFLIFTKKNFPRMKKSKQLVLIATRRLGDCII